MKPVCFKTSGQALSPVDGPKVKVLSRAQAKLVLFVSPADAASPLLAPLVQRLRLAGDTRDALPLQELAREPGFPANALGRRVAAGRQVGEVARISADGRQFWLINARTGAEQLIDAEFWRRCAQGAPAWPFRPPP